ncbi:hypothetical protein [Nonomuraea sp. NPDC002799]
MLQTMIERAFAAGVSFGRVAADEAYGDNGPLRGNRIRSLKWRSISYRYVLQLG